jgi:alkyl sulfatase BDS1-like metallo-beta-lactamase superfamily hydrolase
VQRYAGEWAAALREMAALDAEVLLCGHGMPIFGTDRIKTALTETAELLESLEGQTLALMNAGAALDEVLHTVEVPHHLRDRPYLQPVYDHPQFVVRNIWRRFGGWHDGEADTVLPAPRAQQAREWIALAGGVDKVLARVGELVDSGSFDDLRVASHLVEFAVLAEPGSSAAHSLRSRVYRGRSTMYDSLMARHLMSHAALSSYEGRRDLYGGS